MTLEFESGLSQSFCFYAQLLCLRLATGLNLFDPAALLCFGLVQRFNLSTNLLLSFGMQAHLLLSLLFDTLELG
jgi:hypothetical protein